MAIEADRTENIRMIRDSAQAIAKRGDLRRVREWRDRSPGFDRATWQAMCDLGWVGLRVAEEDGGSGLGMLELCALAEELGAALTPEPLIAGVLAARLLDGAARRDLLVGNRIVLPAWQERADSLDAVGETHVEGGRIYGEKRFAALVEGADDILVFTGQGLMLVANHAAGLTVERQPTQDGGHVATLRFDGVLGDPVSGDPADALEEATLATAAYLLGVIEGALALTLDYLKTRRQFDAPIGSFQALQHRAVDLALQAALTRASVESAAAALDGGATGAPALAAVSRAKARASDAALLVTRQAIQLHGGIGYTDECDIGLYLRKAMVLAPSFGGAALHRRRYAKLMNDSDEL